MAVRMIMSMSVIMIMRSVFACIGRLMLMLMLMVMVMVMVMVMLRMVVAVMILSSHSICIP